MDNLCVVNQTTVKPQPRHPKGSSRGGQWLSSSKPDDASAQKLELQSFDQVLEDVQMRRITDFSSDEKRPAYFLAHENGKWRVQGYDDTIYHTSALVHKLAEEDNLQYYHDMAVLIDGNVMADLLNEGIIEPEEIHFLSDTSYAPDTALAGRIVQNWATVRILNDMYAEQSKYLPGPIADYTDTNDRRTLIEKLYSIYGERNLDNHMEIFYDHLRQKINFHASPFMLSDVLDTLGIPSWKEKPHIFAEMLDGLCNVSTMDAKYLTKHVLHYPLGASYLVSKYHSLGKERFIEWIGEGMYTSGQRYVRDRHMNEHDVLLDSYMVSQDNMELVADMALSAPDEYDRQAAQEVFIALHDYVRSPYSDPVVFAGPRQVVRVFEGSSHRGQHYRENKPSSEKTHQFQTLIKTKLRET